MLSSETPSFCSFSSAERRADHSSLSDVSPSPVLCDGQQILSHLHSDSPTLIQSALSTLDHLLTESDRPTLLCLSDIIFDILQSLSDLSRFSDEASRLLVRFLRSAPPLTIGGSDSQFLAALPSLLTNPTHFGMSLSVIQTVLRTDPVFKWRFLQLGGFSFFADLDLSLISDSDLPAFAGVVAECLHANFPQNLESEQFVSLLNPLITLLNHFQTIPPEALTEAARGCFYFVESGLQIQLFISENFHIVLVNCFFAIPPEGQVFALSAFGFCFQCDEVAELLLRDVPMMLFMQTLSSESDDVRMDAAIALVNVCRSRAVLVPLFFTSGLFDFILERLAIEIYIVKEHLFEALEAVVVAAHSEFMDQFLRPELLEQMKEGREAENGKIDQSIMMIATALLAASTEDEVVREFLDLCAEDCL
jgi:hypothetical protein